MKKAEISMKIIWWIILLILLIWALVWYGGLRTKMLEIIGELF